MPDPQLMKLLDFTEEDWNANQQLQFSPRQLERINTSNTGCRAILGFVVLIGIAAGAFALLAPLDSNERFAIGINALMWGGVAFVLERALGRKPARALVNQELGIVNGIINYIMNIYISKFKNKFSPIKNRCL